MTLETLINQLLEIANQKGGGVEVQINASVYSDELKQETPVLFPIQEVTAHSAYPTKESSPMVLLEM